MNREQAIQAVKEVITQIVQDSGETVTTIEETNVLLGKDLPIDSLDLGAICIMMEQRSGFDPFRNGIIMFRTVGELAELYVQ